MIDLIDFGMLDFAIAFSGIFGSKRTTTNQTTTNQTEINEQGQTVENLGGENTAIRQVDGDLSIERADVDLIDKTNQRFTGLFNNLLQSGQNSLTNAFKFGGQALGAAGIISNNAINERTDKIQAVTDGFSNAFLQKPTVENGGGVGGVAVGLGLGAVALYIFMKWGKK